MWTIFKKDLNMYFSSLAGYIAMGVFLLLMGLAMWIFPDYSVLNYPYTTLDQLFSLAPYIFLFLIPALTMRTFAEERNRGTLELLLSQPLSIAELVLGKYLAVLIVIFFILFPTIVYVYSLYQLGSPPGNIDLGETAGSYLGLYFLGAVFAAIGLFCSAITTNQVIAFVISVFLCFFFYESFFYLSRLPVFYGFHDDIVQSLGIAFHYTSISRGVITSGDVIYFLSVIGVFLWLTANFITETHRNGASSILSFVGKILLILTIAVLVNILFSFFYMQWDLTEEKRYTLTDQTVEYLEELEQPIFVNLLLEGNFPAGFKRLRRSTEELFSDFRRYSGEIHYTFTNPGEGSTEEVNAMRQNLAEQGIEPVNLRLTDAGQRTEQLIYPYALVRFSDRTAVVNLLENDPGSTSPDEKLNESINLLEYKFINAFQKVTLRDPKNIVFAQGHGELTKMQTADFESELRAFYNTAHVNLDSVPRIHPKVDLLIVAKPKKEFDERAKFIIDQYIMNGGSVLWLIDQMEIEIDSLSGGEYYIPQPVNHNLEDLFFKYGFRIEEDLVLDLEASRIPLQVGTAGGVPQFEMFTWYYYPIVTAHTTHPVITGLDRIQLQFPSSIDTLNDEKVEISKTPILLSSEKSRLQLYPARLNFEILRHPPSPDNFNVGHIIMGLMVEGRFPSLYKNRITTSMEENLKEIGQPFKAESGSDVKMMVISDGDIIRNAYNPLNGEMRPLGYDRFEKRMWDNKKFLVNVVDYLVEREGVLEAKNRDIRLRMLDITQAESERAKWQLINVGIPLLFVLLFALIYQWIRHRRYGRKKIMTHG